MRPRQTRATLTALLLVSNLITLPARPSDGASARQQQSGGAQQPPQQQQPPVLKVQVQLVNLFATVRDSHHAIIQDLTKDDFHIFEDGQEQKVAFFSKEVSLPITLGLLVDTSGSEQRMLGIEQEAASRFLHRVLRKGDVSMVMSFDTDVDLLSDFTDDTATLERAIQRTRINAPVDLGPVQQRNVTGTALYDAIYLASHDQLAGEAGRKAMVILTDGQDEGSKKKLQDAVEAAQRADTVIHIILVADIGGFIGRLGYSGESASKKLTEETGGRVIDARNEKKLEEAFDIISEELRSQYVLGYYPTNTARDGAFRKIKVDISRPGLKVLARRGYYAPNK